MYPKYKDNDLKYNMDIHMDKHTHEQTMDKHTNGHMDRHRICKSLRVLYYIMTFSSSQSLEREREREESVLAMLVRILFVVLAINLDGKQTDNINNTYTRRTIHLFDWKFFSIGRFF